MSRVILAATFASAAGFSFSPHVASQTRVPVAVRMDGANEAIALIRELKHEAQTLKDRSRQLDEMVAEMEWRLQQEMQAARTPDLSGLSPQDQAQTCLQEGCPVDMVEDLVVDLKTISAALSKNRENHAYVDQLVGALNSQVDRAGNAATTLGAKYMYGNGRS